MTRLARGYVRHLVRPVGSVRRVGRPSILGACKGAEGKQKKQLYTQNVSPNREPSLDSSTYYHVDIRNGTTSSLERPSILQRLEPEFPIKDVKTEIQDGSQQALSPKEEEIFNSRLSNIWQGMMTLESIPEWEYIISRFSTDKWLSRIAEYIPADVKSMLVSDHPPTPGRLMSLPWSNTTDGGVFAWCTEPNGKQDSTDKTLHVYIGSASKCYGGLKFRKSHMLSRLTTPHDEALKRRIKKLDLNSKGEFKRLFIVPFKNGSDGDIMDVRQLVVLARFALMIWLGAVDGRLKTTSQHLVPWRLEKIEYIGLAKDNPLKTELNKSGRTKTKKIARERNRRRPVVSQRKLSTV